MRNMSVMLTTEAVIQRRKTVTRRLGWDFIEVAEKVQLCEKCQGRKPGEPLVRLAKVEVVSTRQERLGDITKEDVIAEGFPDMTPDEFVDMFCRHMKCTPDTIVNRIEWKYLD